MTASGMLTRNDRTPWAKAPKSGDLIVGCGHTRDAPICDVAPDIENLESWLECVDPSGNPAITINGPDGAMRSRWLAACAFCLAQAGGDPLRVVIRSHFRYA